ncbi:hypothetical protein FHS59_003537 [Algoriphagus iocasae]|uniref:Uncharacterized protein n=1 Tax=Algoriphagus iocasae TaxID=1836499 RepID=A0A841MTD2_9BACT|nr:hypothetical protein [Algoriphagus iocasae]
MLFLDLSGIKFLLFSEFIEVRRFMKALVFCSNWGREKSKPYLFFLIPEMEHVGSLICEEAERTSLGDVGIN